jgi:broad specificity phosphatase PhoE
MKGLWTCVLVGIVVSAIVTPASGLDRIYIVRHAEKVEGWPADKELDALWPLGAAGQARAERLAKALADSGIAAVYATPTTRALATGLPLATQLGCPLRTYPASSELSPVRAFLTRLLQEQTAARAVLLVGHSNTVPTLLRALGAEPDCDGRLGIVPESWGPGIQGHEGLWVVEMQGEGCLRFRRQAAP